jgi:hypothetical protein
VLRFLAEDIAKELDAVLTGILRSLGSRKPDRGSAPDPGSVARGGPSAPLRSLAGALCAPPLCGSAKNAYRIRVPSA